MIFGKNGRQLHIDGVHKIRLMRSTVVKFKESINYLIFHAIAKEAFLCPEADVRSLENRGAI